MYQSLRKTDQSSLYREQWSVIWTVSNCGAMLGPPGLLLAHAEAEQNLQGTFIVCLTVHHALHVHHTAQIGPAATSASQCFCLPGFFSPTLQLGTICEACPVNAECLGSTSQPLPNVRSCCLALLQLLDLMSN